MRDSEKIKLSFMEGVFSCPEKESIAWQKKYHWYDGVWQGNSAYVWPGGWQE